MRTRSTASDDACDLPLFALARANDRSTSIEAAADILPKLTDLQRQFVRGLVACGNSSTANEVAASLTDNPSRRETLRKRANECEECGMIEEIGKRKCSITGKRVTVYRVVTR